jgi:hypothetical protein
MTNQKLINKIEKAIESRMEAKGYGDNPEELEETNSSYIYLTAQELLTAIKMKRCTSVSLSTCLGGHTEQSIEEGKYYTHANSIWVSLTKKQAKAAATKLDGSDMMIKVLFCGNRWKHNPDTNKFSIVL